MAHGAKRPSPLRRRQQKPTVRRAAERAPDPPLPPSPPHTRTHPHTSFFLLSFHNGSCTVCLETCDQGAARINKSRKTESAAATKRFRSAQLATLRVRAFFLPPLPNLSMGPNMKGQGKGTHQPSKPLTKDRRSVLQSQRQG